MPGGATADAGDARAPRNAKMANAMIAFRVIDGLLGEPSALHPEARNADAISADAGRAIDEFAPRTVTVSTSGGDARAVDAEILRAYRA